MEAIISTIPKIINYISSRSLRAASIPSFTAERMSKETPIPQTPAQKMNSIKPITLSMNIVYTIHNILQAVLSYLKYGSVKP